MSFEVDIYLDDRLQTFLRGKLKARSESVVHAEGKTANSMCSNINKVYINFYFISQG